jgi:hypothetical protein
MYCDLVKFQKREAVDEKIQNRLLLSPIHFNNSSLRERKKIDVIIPVDKTNKIICPGNLHVLKAVSLM